MTQKIPGQISLLQPEKKYDTQEILILDGHDLPVTYGTVGSYVDVAERAGHLVLALDAISQRNQRDGLSLAAYTQMYSAPIWAHYRSETPSVLDGASKNRDKFQDQLRYSFWRATGFSALRGALKGSLKRQGLMPESQVNPRAQKMWRDFNSAFGHPSRLAERNEYKKVLMNQLPDSDEVAA